MCAKIAIKHPRIAKHTPPSSSSSSLYPAATMADEDPRHEQLHSAIYDGDDATALSIVRGGVDVNGEWDGYTTSALHHSIIALLSSLASSS